MPNIKDTVRTITVHYDNGSVLILTLGDWTTKAGQMFWNGMSICKADEYTVGKYHEITFVQVY